MHVRVGDGVVLAVVMEMLVVVATAVVASVAAVVPAFGGGRRQRSLLRMVVTAVVASCTFNSVFRSTGFLQTFFKPPADDHWPNCSECRNLRCTDRKFYLPSQFSFI